MNGNARNVQTHFQTHMNPYELIWTHMNPYAIKGFLSLYQKYFSKDHKTWHWVCFKPYRPSKLFPGQFRTSAWWKLSDSGWISYEFIWVHMGSYECFCTFLSIQTILARTKHRSLMISKRCVRAFAGNQLSQQLTWPNRLAVLAASDCTLKPQSFSSQLHLQVCEPAYGFFTWQLIKKTFLYYNVDRFAEFHSLLGRTRTNAFPVKIQNSRPRTNVTVKTLDISWNL